ncbi:MAG: HupE/UreJ family protein [Marinirhabdus sp.]|nr:HupE/UreJ family protein [Marinirhabdus sp.]
MTDFWLYLKLGFEHVLDWNAYDHTLFIIALCASHTLKTWRVMLIHVTFFTIGHSVSLALASYGLLSAPSSIIEFLIPVTIIATALLAIRNALKGRLQSSSLYFIILTFFFGIIHGFGFAGYFRMINKGNMLAHLLEFALGIELAQVAIAFLVVLVGYLAQKFVQLRYWVLAISTLVFILAIPMLIENWIF